MKETLALGIDLGGSKIYAVITNDKHEVLASAKLPTDPTGGPERTVEIMKETAEAALTELNLTFSEIKYFGAAVPSPVDPETGNCVFATNLAWKKANLRSMLSKAFGYPFVLGNDGNLGQVAEHFCGAAKGCHSSVGFFVGTGLGGGIIVDDHLVVGNSGLAGEVGHMIIRNGGRRCGCGHRGCAEAYCSKKAFVKALKKEVFVRGGTTELPKEKFDKDTENIKSKHLMKAYKHEDPCVRKVVDKGLRMLGIAAADVCAVTAPQCVVLGGGFVESMGETVLDVFLPSFRKHLFGIDPDKIAVRISALGDSAVAVGATILARGLVK